MKRLLVAFFRRKPEPPIKRFTWVDVVDGLPPVGKLVYVKLQSGRLSAYTFWGNEIGWSSKLDTSNEAILAWYDQTI